jgi:aminobenzoyl-glutamate utilization protein A
MPKLISLRRDFHKYAETGWNEYRTASIIAEQLEQLGYELLVGREIIDGDARMGLPEKNVREKQYDRALSQGAAIKHVERMADGYTGVVGTISNGVGPTIALRFDIDALDLTETDDADHLPNKEGFASVNGGAMHACGHDAHAAIGIGVAEVVSRVVEHLCGTVKLIFQPAEEGVRGAKSVATSGVLDDVDFLYGLHIGMKAKESGEVCCGTEGFLATKKFDAVFKGRSSHAGVAPEEGRNALMAASAAIMNLYAIPRHSAGSTRINVGNVYGGTGRNCIPDYVRLSIETRGVTAELNDYMMSNALRILESSAQAQDTTVEIEYMGDAGSGVSDEPLVTNIRKIAESLDVFTTVYAENTSFGGSEDFTHLMHRVQMRGGLSTYVMLGTQLKANHHDPRFDIVERDIINGVKLLSLAALLGTDSVL